MDNPADNGVPAHNWSGVKGTILGETEPFSFAIFCLALLAVFPDIFPFPFLSACLLDGHFSA